MTQQRMSAEGFKYLVGLTLEEAQNRKLQGYRLRVVKEDGVEQMVTMEMDLYRVNVEVSAGKVTAVRGMG